MTVTPNTIYQGDVLEVLRGWPDECVQCVVTSPPYWGLRDYGIPPRVWGGDNGCEHVWNVEPLVAGNNRNFVDRDGRGSNNPAIGETQGSCSRCGAWRGTYGLEPTIEMHVEHAVEIFREVRRVLRGDGTLWLNYGDTYNAGRNGGWAGGKRGISKPENAPARTGVNEPSLKPKDLCGIPWRVALALQADGWWLRSDIIWHKPNPMPDSATDRPGKAHEYLFLLSKKTRYYYDGDAIKTPPKSETDKMPDGWDTTKGNGSHGSHHKEGREKGKKTDKQRGHGRRHAGFNDRWDSMSKEQQQATGANKRSVWTVATHPYKEAHFATFPPKLIEPCVLAGCPAGGVVLDPFMGSGTTAVVAKGLGRKWLGIELNPEYIEMANRRIRNTQGSLFSEEAL